MVRRKNKFANWPIALQLMPVNVIIRCVCMWIVSIVSIFRHWKMFIYRQVPHIECCDEYIRWMVGNSSTFDRHPIHFATMLLSSAQTHFIRTIFFVSKSRYVFWGEKFDSGTATQALENNRKKRTNNQQKKRTRRMSETKDISIKSRDKNNWLLWNENMIKFMKSWS